MSIRTSILNPRGVTIRGVSTNEKCAYCSKPAVKYVWCKEHMLQMQLIRRAVARHLEQTE